MGGAVVPPVGGAVVLPVGGAVVLPVGGVDVPGVWACPEAPELPAGAEPPAGAVCATIQVAQQKTTANSRESFLIDIQNSKVKIFEFLFRNANRQCSKENSTRPSVDLRGIRTHPADALMSAQ